MLTKDLAASVENVFNSIRVWIFAAMLTVVAVPMFYIVEYQERQAFSRELQKVQESHLVIARNMAAAFEKYAADLVSVFDYIALGGKDSVSPEAAAKLLEAFNYRYIVALSADDRQQWHLGPISPTHLNAATISHLRHLAKEEQATISGLRLVEGEPVMFVVRKDSVGNLFAGAVETTYLKSLQRQIAFGERGHAMVVDRGGRVIAHPKTDWEESVKDVSKLEVIQNMMNGKTGVMQFFAPPLKADVIAGYTSVEGPGWGVMVPQPIEELHKAAAMATGRFLRTVALILAAAGLASWLLANLISKPVCKLSRAVSEIQNGNSGARVTKFQKGAPAELKSLRVLFNGLMDKLSERSARLERSVLAAQEASELKSKAITVLSHEMRTPLNGIVGVTDLLKTTHLTEKQQRYVDLLSRSSDALLKHVNDVLEIGRLQSGVQALNVSSFDLGEVLENLVSQHEGFAQSHGSEIVLDPDAGGVGLVETDKERLRNVVANLLSNAIKFSDGKRVEVFAEWVSNKDIELRVHDHGFGISEDDVSKVFEPFTVLDASFARRFEGSGLGLNIVATCAEALGGSCGVESELGAGSTFWVKFPAKAPSVPALATKQKRQHRVNTFLPSVELAEPVAE